MDVFAHALWAGAAARGANLKLRSRVRPLWAAFWGVFPDVFAFTWPIAVSIWQQVVERKPPGQARTNLALAWDLYQVSHSLVIFALVFGLAWLVARRPVLELLGWPLHILIDIPTHTERFFPTPFLWPLSTFRASGISWGNRWFMITNYSALAAAYLLLWVHRRRQQTP
ncbi:MAG: hypothetical protein KIT09_12810 [Bryobacteraceae bacterium]|nr:hypothetical protein [Bryobacteraceae bacterium]